MGWNWRKKYIQLLGHYTPSEKASNFGHRTNQWECEDEPLTEIRIGEKSQKSNWQLPDWKANATKIATEFYSAPPHATPIFINDLEQGVQLLMRKENEDVASPQTE